MAKHRGESVPQRPAAEPTDVPALIAGLVVYRQATMTQIADAMGWRSYASANSHYGSLAKLVALEIGFDSTRLLPQHTLRIRTSQEQGASLAHYHAIPSCRALDQLRWAWHVGDKPFLSRETGILRGALVRCALSQDDLKIGVLEPIDRCARYLR